MIREVMGEVNAVDRKVGEKMSKERLSPEESEQTRVMPTTYPYSTDLESDGRLSPKDTTQQYSERVSRGSSAVQWMRAK